MQVYSDPTREADPNSLPDVEVFYSADYAEGSVVELEDGYYWWSCVPGCLPDGDPNGPFPTEAEAVADAQSE